MESIGKSLNDDERFKKPSSINDKVKDNVHKITDEEAEGIAEHLIQKFSEPECREYFLKVAYRLPHGTIDRLLATAKEKGKSPIKLFIHLSEREIRRLRGDK